MSFFSGFPQELYRFGNETTQTLFQNISAYVDLLDRVKEDTSFYSVYTILEGDRPDVLSQKLYGSTNYYWTFYYLNDSIRNTGWPVSNFQVTTFAKEKHPNTTLVVREYFFDKFNVGRTLIGTNSGTSATIISRDVNLGHIVVEGVHTFEDGEVLTIVQTADEINDGVPVQSITLDSYSEEYNSAKYYVNSSGEIIDIDPTVGPGAQETPVTFIEYYEQVNDQNRQIKVLKPDVAPQIFTAFKKELNQLVN